MKNYFNDKKNLLIGVVIIIIVVIVIFIIFSFRKVGPGQSTGVVSKTFKGMIISDNIKIPDTKNITGNEGELVPRGEYNIKLQPQSETEQVFISNAKFTLKGAYELSKTVAGKWSADQKLVFIKSNGAISLDGLSSSWQLIYSSALMDKTYEIIIQADKIISAKEITSYIKGAELPVNWYDSNEAIISFQTLPQFKADTISGISFYYSDSADSWAYGLATDNGKKTTAMWVK